MVYCVNCAVFCFYVYKIQFFFMIFFFFRHTLIAITSNTNWRVSVCGTLAQNDVYTLHTKCVHMVWNWLFKSDVHRWTHVVIKNDTCEIWCVFGILFSWFCFEMDLSLKGMEKKESWLLYVNILLKSSEKQTTLEVNVEIDVFYKIQYKFSIFKCFKWMFLFIWTSLKSERKNC